MDWQLQLNHWLSLHDSAAMQNDIDGPSTSRGYREAADLPLPEQPDYKVGSKSLVEQLGDEIQVGDEGRLQDDGHVGGVEQLNGVGAVVASPLPTPDRQIHPEALHAIQLSLSPVRLSGCAI